MNNQNMCDKCKTTNYMQNCQCLDELPYGIAYVPWQKWKNVLCAYEGMEHGTIFSDLIMPFYGCSYKFRRQI